MSQPPGYPPQPPGGVPPAQPPGGAYPPQGPPPGGGYPPQGPPPGGGYPPPGVPPGGGYPPQGPSPYGAPGGGAPPQTFKLQKRNTVLIVGLAVAAVAVLGLLAWALLGGRGGEAAAAGEPGAPPGGPAPTGTFQPTPVGTPPPAPPPPGESPAPTPPASEPAPQPQPTGGPAGPGTPVVGGPSIALGDDVALIPVPEGWEAQHVVEDATQATVSDGQGHFVWAGLFNADPAQSAAELIAENRDTLLNSEIYSQLETGEVQAVQPTGSLVSLAQVTYSGLVTDNQASAQVAGLLVLGVRQDGFVLALTGDISPAQDPTSQEFVDDFGATIAPILNGAYANFGGTGQ